MNRNVKNRAVGAHSRHVCGADPAAKRAAAGGQPRPPCNSEQAKPCACCASLRRPPFGADSRLHHKQYFCRARGNRLDCRSARLFPCDSFYVFAEKKGAARLPIISLACPALLTDFGRSRNGLFFSEGQAFLPFLDQRRSCGAGRACVCSRSVSRFLSR